MRVLNLFLNLVPPGKFPGRIRKLSTTSLNYCDGPAQAPSLSMTGRRCLPLLRRFSKELAIAF